MNEGANTYAEFWKCALQVNPHSYGRRSRGQDHGMGANAYATALRDGCRAQKIAVVGLADHGSVDEAVAVRKVLADANIVVFPGFEVATTEKVHWVCLFAEDTTEPELERYLEKLGVTNPRDGVSPSTLSGRELLAEVKELGGFCFAAHVTDKSGLLGGKFNNLWIDHQLRAAQIPGPIHQLPSQYEKIIRNEDPEYMRDRPIAVINAKDVSKPEHLNDPRSSCLIKMTRPCFESFLMAFKDPESRIRLADDVQDYHYSQIDSIVIEGGYFDGLTAGLSGHLNAVIGGRGTGKSTLLECVRYALDVPHKGKGAARQGRQIVGENLGREGGRVILKLRSARNHMKAYTVIRRYGEPPRVLNEQGDESRLHPSEDLLPGVEIFGQNEIHELAKSPGGLTRVLDRFLPEGDRRDDKLAAAYERLRENGGHLAKVRERRDEIEQRLAQLPGLRERVAQFREQGLETRLKEVPLLEKERQLVPRLQEEVDRVRAGLKGLEESLPDLTFLSDRALDPLPRADLLRQGRETVTSLKATAEALITAGGDAVTSAESALGPILDELTRAMDAVEKRLARDFSELPEVAGRDGKAIGRTYQRLLREIEEMRPAEAQLATTQALDEELEQSRRNLLGEISDLRSARTAATQETIKRLNERLAGNLRISLVPDGLREPLREFLQSLSGVGSRKTEWVNEAEGLTIAGLVDAVSRGSDALLEKGWGLTAGLSETLTKMTSDQIYRLESIDLLDRVTLALNVSHEGERFRPLDKLSTGQQCTAILHLLLLDNEDPLIMDQPEDNLDNAFIAERIVRELRTAKTERQFLFATHNANIPVFGDAEWIGVCTSSGDRAEMLQEAQGSIDIPAIRNHVANILEGGREAFMQRKEKYGFDF